MNASAVVLIVIAVVVIAVVAVVLSRRRKIALPSSLPKAAMPEQRLYTPPAAKPAAPPPSPEPAAWPTPEQIATFPERYRNGEGTIKTIAGVRYRALPEFRQRSLGGKEGVHLTEHTLFQIDKSPMDHVPDMPLDTLRQALEAFLQQQGAANPTSRIVRQKQLHIAVASAPTVMPVGGTVAVGVMTAFAFFGPGDLYQGRFFSLIKEAELLQPVIDGVIDSFYFDDAELGEPEMGDDEMRKTPKIDIGGGRSAVVVGMFPIADEQGRLLCKNCGTPFDKMTVEAAHQYFKVVITRNSSMGINCRKCNVPSVFLKSDLPAGVAEPTLA